MDTENASAPGWGDQMAAIMTGYMSKRMDASIESSLARVGSLTRVSTQTPLLQGPDVGLPTINLGITRGTFLMLAGAAVIVFLVVKKG